MKLWNQLDEGFAQLSSREKGLVFLLGLVAIFFISLTLLVEPAIAVKKIQQQQLQLESSQQQRLQIEIAAAKQELTLDPDEEINNKLAALSQHSQQLSMQLSNFVDRLITPSEMAVLLETVLQSSNNLTLQSLKSMPAEPIIAGDSEQADYFIHPVKMELTGNYFNIQAFLIKLESMKVDYFWRDFDYQVDQYPNAKLVLVVYTLGTRQEFIGG